MKRDRCKHTGDTEAERLIKGMSALRTRDGLTWNVLETLSLCMIVAEDGLAPHTCVRANPIAGGTLEVLRF